MKNSRWVCGLMGLLVLALTMPAWADDDEKSVLDGVTLSNHIAGPTVNADSVRGKVVLFVFWDSDSSSAAAGLRKLRSWMNDYDDSGRFAVIISHTGSSVETAMEVCRQTGMNLPVYHQEHLNEADSARLGSSTFYGYLYNYDARVNNLEDDLKDLMDEVPMRATPLTEGVEVMHNQDLAKELVPGNSIKRSLIGLERRAQGDDEEAAEAQAIIDAVNAWIELELTEVAEQIPVEPARAFIRLAVLKETLKGMDELDQVKELAEPLREDDNVEDLAEIILKMEKLQEMADDQGPTRQVATGCQSLERAIERFLNHNDLTEVLRTEAQAVSEWRDAIEADVRAQQEACR